MLTPHIVLFLIITISKINAELIDFLNLDFNDVDDIVQMTDNIELNMLNHRWNESVKHPRPEVLKAMVLEMTNLISELDNTTGTSTQKLSWETFITKLKDNSLQKIDAGTFYIFLTIHKLNEYMRTIDNVIDILSKRFINPLIAGNEDLCPFVWIHTSFLNKQVENSLDFEYSEALYFISEKINKLNNSGILCNFNLSSQQGLDILNKLVIKAKIKKFILSMYHWNLLSECTPTNYTRELSYEKQTFVTNYKNHIDLTKKFLSNTTLFITRCDNDNVIQLERMLFSIIYRDYENDKLECSKRPTLSFNNIDTWHGCQEIRDCRFLGDSHQVCKLSDQYDRQYQWLSAGNEIYGDFETCKGTIEKLESEFNFFSSRFFCSCTCASIQRNSPHVITTLSFMDQVSDVSNNMVVTGIKFIEKNLMVHVQIQEGKLLPYGKIDSNTVSWKPLGNYTFDNALQEYLVIREDGYTKKLIPDKSYARPNVINFDDLVAPENHVITGVRLRYEQCQYQTKAIQLEIRVTPFDYYQGTLIMLNNSRLITPQCVERNELKLSKPDHPLKSPGNTIDSRNAQFVRFQKTDFKKDASQTTVPFFDGQSVEGEPHFPLSGVGLIHRGREGFGGLLAFRIFSLDLSTYM